MTDFVARLFRQPEYLHVLLNPVPVYGLAIGLVGLIIALLLRSRPAQIATLALVLISTASAWPVYGLGKQAYDRVLSMSDDNGHAWLDEHARRADELIVCFYALALVSAVAIFLPIKWPRCATALSIVTMLYGFAVLGMGAYVGYAGGKIRHREFRTGPAPPPANHQL
jgi:hypothetical protein